MDLAKTCMFNAISQIFFSFFLVLFFIASMVMLISIASVTLVVKLSFLDLAQLYIYSLPGTIFFIIPITFFGACAIGLARLSYDHELLVFFSLGIAPKQIVKAFLPLCIFVSLVLLIFSLILIPASKSAYYSFLRAKKDRVDVNIQAGEFGQKLGDWLVYVGHKKKDIFSNLVLFSHKGLAFESFMIAQSGQIKNQEGVFGIELRKGDAYFADKNQLRKVHFETLNLRNKLAFSAKKDAAYLHSHDYVSYWKKAFGHHPDKNQQRRFTQAILVSLFPLASLFLIPLFGIANPRFSKNLSYVYVLLAVGLYFLGMHVASQDAPISGTILLPIVWMLGAYGLYRRIIVRFY
ncbi:LptF/LptG family permease [Helicobacter suis]|uniref:LptF/LptG family permease n=1 Tax=Helicobacter suis TaxID=104628 RepID=A0ABM7L1F6_9HELI|nr:LptF/LptG family permease [Helicobacter suis]BCD46587.1 LptF/LptG family permease [Helicobacter suis]BCD51291.1 LptF/LptG family permease [Helicobacter suis]